MSRADPLIQKTLENLPKVPGIYMFKDGMGAVIYVGKAINLYNRVRSYFNPRAVRQDGRRKIIAMIRHIRRIETIEVKSEAEALILESRLIKEYKPKYNTSLVDDKRFLLVRLDNSDLPTFRLCRNRVDAKSIYYGPFVHGPLIRKVYQELRRRYGVLLSDSSPKKLKDGSYQLYDDVRAQIFPEHPNIVTRQEYLQRVNRATAFLEGQSRQWREEVAAKMQAAADAQRYEEATKWRDLLEAIEHAKNPQKKFLRDPMMDMQQPAGALEQLQKALGMAHPPRAIECFDISHISGSFVVASMVRFDDGRPNKSLYRRFKVRGTSAEGASPEVNPFAQVNDDYAAMREVVTRHYRRRYDEQPDLIPDLIVIDGGAGQLKSALGAFIEGGIQQPPLMIGLAKREETFVFADGRAPLTLPRTHPGLRLLQRVRDEAHRVANSYNAQWRARQLKTSILDDCPGLGPKRRTALLEKYPSLERLKKATIDQIAAVPGIGDKQAQVIVEYLARLG